MQYRVKIYQINSDRDKNRVIFAGSDYLMKNESVLNIDRVHLRRSVQR